jgi:hypothetical protein
VKGPEPRVRYWHPEREFKWTPSNWEIASGLADQSLELGQYIVLVFGRRLLVALSISRGAAAAAAAGGIRAAGASTAAAVGRPGRWAEQARRFLRRDRLQLG